ncbi:MULTISPECIES: TMEM175 family protein [unclassified Actinotalea]|uniref:TMEM175 family protein n=1 Tax=unclassified Actinotalea TaxID=2638618 RepID=UPI0015F74CD8|nr:MULTISPECIES: TMEM175 family protein [unclassified Actinotalea]
MRTDRGLDRLVNFTDAAVAIAITLLVLPLVDVVTDGEQRTVAELLTQEAGTFLAFAISFVVIASFWVGHHRVFEHLQDYSRAMLWANFLWLASIVLIPFTTQLLADDGTDVPAVNALYISTMIVTTGSILLIEWLAVREPELQRAEVRGSLTLRNGAVALGLLLVALVLAVVAPRVGMFWLLLLFLADPLARLTGGRRGRDAGAAPEAP